MNGSEALALTQHLDGFDRSNIKIEIDESAEEFIRSTRQTVIPHTDDEIEIKEEAVDLWEKSEINDGHEHDPGSDLPEKPYTINQKRRCSDDSINSRKKQSIYFNFDLNRCEWNCKSCQIDVNRLRRHLKDHHSRLGRSNRYSLRSKQHLNDFDDARTSCSDDRPVHTEETAYIVDDTFDIKCEPVEVMSETIDEIDPETATSVHNESNKFDLDLVKCEWLCETCQKLIGKLSNHVDTTHPRPGRPIHDPILINVSGKPVDIAVQGECDVPEMESNEGANLDFEKTNDDSNPPSETSRNLTRGLHCKTGILSTRNCTQDDQIICDICGEQYRNKSQLNEHSKSHVGEKQITYETGEKSGERYHKDYKVVSYQNTQTEDKLPTMKKRNIRKTIHSSETYSDSTALTNNFPAFEILDVQVSSDSKIFPSEKLSLCDVCGQSFGQIYQLNDHKRVHHGEKPLQCDNCEKIFKTSKYYYKHIKNHHPEEIFKCNKCKKTFSKLENLNLHKQKTIHTKDKLFKCDICEKRFTSNGYLCIHKRNHTAERPFMCHLCSNTFSRWTHLASHIGYHTGERPFMCNVCDKNFSHKCNLVAHERTHTKKKSILV